MSEKGEKGKMPFTLLQKKRKSAGYPELSSKIAESFEKLKTHLKSRATVNGDKVVLEDLPYTVTITKSGNIFFKLDDEVVATLGRRGLKIVREECAEDVRGWCKALAAILKEDFSPFKPAGQVRV